jgi:hypothetical protein
MLAVRGVFTLVICLITVMSESGTLYKVCLEDRYYCICVCVCVDFDPIALRERKERYRTCVHEALIVPFHI